MLRSATAAFVLLASFVLLAAPATPARAQSAGPAEQTLYVKFESQSVQAVERATDARGAVTQTNAQGVPQTAIASVNQLNARFDARGMKRVFRPAGKFEQRHRAFGLHRWYEVRLAASTSMQAAVSAYAASSSITVAEERKEKEFKDGYEPGATKARRASASGRAGEAGASEAQRALGEPNDPLFDQQWHYRNTGQSPPGGTSDADIDLPGAYDIERGDSAVVVANHDEGIDVDHEDLEANVWVNEGETPGNGIDDDDNGFVDDVHGYNFADGEGPIAPGEHGTHTGGTVAAVTGNGTGVAGVAGGGDEGGGVQVMSAQIFGDSGFGGVPESFTYAADMGAVISQNSWGYSQPGAFPQVTQDAIDYYLANAGGAGTPMQSGVMIFSAGNDANDGDGQPPDAQWYPGYYEPVMAIASTNIDDERTGFSNYGEWVDLAAPGGTDLPFDENDVLSTILNDEYGYLAGTSMAAPHVSGVAALVASFRKDLTGDEVREALASTADDISGENPNFDGLLGAGRLNARRALEGFDPDDGTPPGPITDLEGAPTDLGNTVELTWSAPPDDDDASDSGPVFSYQIAYTTDSPIEDSTAFANATLAANDPLPAENVGDAQTALVRDLAFDTEYFFAVRAVDDNGNTSLSSGSASATTGAPPELALSPGALDVTLEPFATNETQLTISNDGTSALAVDLRVDYRAEDQPPAQPEFSSTTDFERGDRESRFGPAPDATGGLSSAGGALPDVIGDARGYGVDAISRQFSSLPLDAPREIVPLSTQPPQGFSAAGVVGPVPTDAYAFVGTALYQIDVPTGAFSKIDDVPAASSGSGFSGMAFDPADSTYYGVTVAESGAELYTLAITDSSVSATSVGTVDEVPGAIALAVGGDGALYTYGINNDQLVRLDKETAEGTVIGSIGFDANFAQGMAYDEVSGRLYMAAFNDAASQGELRVVDTETGGTALVGTLGRGGVNMGWFATTVPEEAGYLEIASDTTVAPGSSVTLDAAFDADGLVRGDYNAEVILTSNDPDDSPTDVPVTMKVRGGTPDVALGADALDFDTIVEGDSTTRELTVRNEGNLALDVTDFSTGSDAFLVEEIPGDSLSVPPFDSTTVRVTFAPPSDGAFSETLTLATSDPDDGTVDVPLSGDAIPAPGLAVAPDSLGATLTAGEAVTRSLTIENTGESELTVDLRAAYYEGARPNFDFPIAPEDASGSSAEATLGRLESASGAEVAAADTSAIAPQGVNGYGVVTLTTGVREFATFDVGTPGGVDAIDQIEVGGFSGAGAIGGDPSVAYTFFEQALYSVDTGTGGISKIGTAGTEFPPTGMAYDAATDTYYLIDSNGQGSTLYTIDVDDASIENVGAVTNLPGAIALAVGRGDRLYAYGVVEDRLVQIDKSSAEGTVVGPIGFDANGGQGLSYDPITDQMYMSAYNVDASRPELRAVDTETGATALVGVLAERGLTRQFGWLATGVPRDRGFLSFSKRDVTVSPGNSESVDVTFEADSLKPDSYFADLVLDTNIPARPLVRVPAALTVEPAPYPFALSPEDISASLDLTEGDSTVTRALTVENTTDEAQNFRVETRGSAGDGAVSRSFRSPAQRRRFEALQQRRAEADAATDAPPLSYGSNGQLRGPDGPVSTPDRRRAADSASSSSSPLLAAPRDMRAHSSVIVPPKDRAFLRFDLGTPSDLFALAPAPFIRAGDFAPRETAFYYAINDENNQLLEVDTETGERTPVGRLPTQNGDEKWRDLSGHPVSNKLYAVSAIFGNRSRSFLYEIDPRTTEATRIGEITGVSGSSFGTDVRSLAIDENGTFYAGELNTNQLVKLDPETAEASIIGEFGFDVNCVQSLDIELATGTLYMATGRTTNFFGCRGELHTVDPETGEATFRGTFGQNGINLSFLAMPSGGFLFAEADPTGGTVPAGGQTTIDVQIDATDLRDGAYEAEVAVIAEAFGEPERTVPVALDVTAAPVATFRPQALAFGTQPVGGDTTAVVTLTNTGRDVLDVTGLEATTDAFSLADTTTTSFSLQPSQARAIAVTFAPQGVQSYDGRLTLSSNDGRSGVSVPLTGEGAAAATVAVTPESGFTIDVQGGSRYERTFAVENTGGSVLDYAVRDTLIGAAETAAPDEAQDVVFEDVLVEEGFDGGIPSSWTVVEGRKIAWTTSGSNYTGGDGRAAYADAGNTDDTDDMMFSTALRTPSLTARSGAYTLTYRANYIKAPTEGQDTLDVDISTDGGDSWTTLLRWTESHGEFRGAPGERVQLSLGEYVEAGDDFMVRWRYHGFGGSSGGWYAQVDEVDISGGLSFLAVEPGSGDVAPGATDSVDVRVDAGELPSGTYEGALALSTNDPTQPLASVPLTVDVAASLTAHPGGEDLTRVHPGETVQVPVRIDRPAELSDASVSSYEFALAYPDSLVTATGIATEGSLSESGVDVSLGGADDDTPGRVSVSGSATGDGAIGFAEGASTLVFVEMQATGDALGEGALSFSGFQLDGGDEPVRRASSSVRVTPLYGDATLNAEVSSLDANQVLRSLVGEVELSGVAQTSVEVSGNGSVWAFDAALIFEKLLGEIDCFPVDEGCSGGGASALAGAQQEGAVGTLAWGESQQASGAGSDSGSDSDDKGTPTARDASFTRVPLKLEDTSGPVRALQFTVELDQRKVALENVESRLPDDWQVAHHVTDGGELKVAMAGRTPLETGPVAAVTLRWKQRPSAPTGSAGGAAPAGSQQVALAGEAALNEAAPQALERTTVRVVPDEFSLDGNYPNPFRQSTKIAVNLPSDADVTLEVYDALGRRVLRRERTMAAGAGRPFEVGGASLASGVYFYRVTAEAEDGGEHSQTGKMILVR
jgi:hypothetical protein